MSLGNLFGGGKQTTTSTQTSEPWGEQQPFLTQGFDEARRIYEARKAAGPFPGQYVAQNNQMQTDAANRAGAFAAGPGVELARTAAGTASTLQGATPSFLENAMRMAMTGSGGPDPQVMAALRGYGTGAQPIGGVSSPLSRALEESALAGTQALGAGSATLRDVAARAMEDPTAATAAAAGTYANNPTLNAAIEAARAPIRETLGSVTLPALNRAATLGGNLNSSRAAMAEAMARRDTADREAALEATMRGDAYRAGLGLAADQRQAGLTTAAGAAGSLAGIGGDAASRVAGLQQDQGQFETGARMGALGQVLSSDLSNRSLDAQTRLGANAQIGGGVQTGLGAGQAATQAAAGSLALGQEGGSILQQGDERAIQDAMARYQAENGGWDQGALNDFWRIVGSGNWGNTTTGTQTTQGSGNPVGGLLGTALGVGSMFASGGMFGPMGAFPGVGSAIGGLFGGGGGGSFALPNLPSIGGFRPL